MSILTGKLCLNLQDLNQVNKVQYNVYQRPHGQKILKDGLCKRWQSILLNVHQFGPVSFVSLDVH